MRVLWTVNLIPASLAERLGLPGEVLGGWVESMARELCTFGEIELAIACKTGPEHSFRQEVSGVRFYSLGYAAKTGREALCGICEEIVRDFQPDLIHIEGSEFPHAGAMLEVAGRLGIPAVVSLQGILNGQYQYQCGHLAIDDMMWSGPLGNRAAAWLLHLRKTRWYLPRMKPERELISKAKYILGRTSWDRAHCYYLNPDATYFPCRRILREPFYHAAWDPEAMEKHSLYVGNGYYALKGLHFAVQAAALLRTEYPDIKVYVAGYPPYSEHDKRPFYKKGYGLYLKKLIDSLGLEGHILFTGPLPAERVAERLSRVNAYVLCSVAENSPNTLGEAMMVGTPCVASYVGGVSDMATDGEEALLYRDDDPVMLAWCIKRIFDDADLASSLSEKARLRARDTHDPGKNADDLVSAYRAILLQEKTS